MDSEPIFMTDNEEVVRKSSGLHSGNILSSLMKLRCDDTFCDVTIICGDYQVKVHKNVLASATEYFKAMFLNETKEAESGIVDYSEMSSEVVKQCVDFIYTGSVEISMKTVRGLLDASEMMQLLELSSLCAEFLAERVTMGSCGEVLSLSVLYSSETLDESIKMFLLGNFEEFQDTEEYKNLEFEAVFKCVEFLDDGNSSSEIRKWDAIITWVTHDLTERERFFYQLFEIIDLTSVSKSFVKETVMRHSLVKTSVECLTTLALLYTKENELAPTMAGEKTLMKIFSLKSQVIIQHDLKTGNSRAFARIPGKDSKYYDVISYRGCIYVGNGVGIYRFSNGAWAKGMMTVYESEGFYRNAKCNECNSFLGHRCHNKQSECYNRCVGVKGNLYMVTTSCFCEYGIWRSTIKRFELNKILMDGFLITASDKKIYGIDRLSYQSYVAFEIDIDTKVCSNLSVMPMSDPFVATYLNGKIYVFDKFFKSGTCDKKSRVFCYNPDTCHYTSKELTVNLQTFSKKLSVSRIGDKLYIVGGDDEEPFQTIDIQELNFPDDGFSSKRKGLAVN